MATIIISGPIEVCDEQSNEEITDPAKLKQFDGVEEKGANLAEFLDGELAHLGLARGDLKLKYDAMTRRVLVESIFEAPKKLSPKQLKALVAYTRGQWSDGAGEGAFYKLMDKHGVGLDLTPSGSERKTRAQQTDQGGQKLNPTPALVVAAEKGDTAKVQKLLGGGADINTRGKQRQTALHEAILYDHFQLAALLIARGADVNLTDRYGNTPLAAAAMAANLATVKRLIAAGADVNVADKEGVTPLMWAANRGSAPIVKLLLEHGADPNAQDRVKDNEGGTPLMYTAPGSKGVAELLLAHGAKPGQRDRFKHTAVDHALEQAQAFERSGDNRDAAKWRKLAAQLKKYVK